MTQPQIIILAGPNGAGKSTVQPFLIPRTMAFLNADEIARGLREQGATPGASADIAAGRVVFARMNELEQAGQSFAIETNLANKTLAQRIPRWQEAGFQVSVIYLWVRDVTLAIQRVRQRVLAGGHDIPEETIRRRYYLGLRNLFSVYVLLADRWRIYDNGSSEGPQLVERGTRETPDRDSWRQLRMLADEARIT